MATANAMVTRQVNGCFICTFRTLFCTAAPGTFLFPHTSPHAPGKTQHGIEA